jgi:hypothetical protein
MAQAGTPIHVAWRLALLVLAPRLRSTSAIAQWTRSTLYYGLRWPWAAQALTRTGPRSRTLEAVQRGQARLMLGRRRRWPGVALQAHRPLIRGRASALLRQGDRRVRTGPDLRRSLWLCGCWGLQAAAKGGILRGPGVALRINSILCVRYTRRKTGARMILRLQSAKINNGAEGCT